MRGDDRGREACRLADNFSGVGHEGRGREAYEVAENPQGYRQGVGVGVGVESPKGTDTLGVSELPQGDKTPGVVRIRRFVKL